MSLIQGVVGSAVSVTPPAPPAVYPVPGSNYPAGVMSVAAGSIVGVNGYYPWPTFISTNPQTGLWRKTYTGMALNGTTFDSNFPGSYTQVRSELDAPVGFGSATDGATNYSMEWLGYFVPESDGLYTFSSQVDDYMFMWIGTAAVSGFDNTNYLLKDTMVSGKLPLMSGRWYPVRIRYTEIAGGNQMTIVHGLDGQTMRNNLDSTTGAFFKTDNNTNSGQFPNGLQM